MGKKRKGSTCDKVTKGTPTKGASMSCKGKSARKKIKKDRGKRGNVCDRAMKSIAKVEEELSGRIEEKGEGALWQRSTRESTSTRVRMVHKGSNSDICAV